MAFQMKTRAHLYELLPFPMANQKLGSLRTPVPPEQGPWAGGLGPAPRSEFRAGKAVGGRGGGRPLESCLIVLGVGS